MWSSDDQAVAAAQSGLTIATEGAAAYSALAVFDGLLEMSGRSM